MRVVLDKSYRHCGLISEESNSFSCNGLLYLKTTIGVQYFFCLFHVTCDNQTCFAKDASLNSVLQFFDTVVVEIFLCNNPVEFDISCYHKIALTVIARAEWLLFYFIFVSNSIRESIDKEAASFRQAVRTLTEQHHLCNSASVLLSTVLWVRQVKHINAMITNQVIDQLINIIHLVSGCN